MTRLVVEAIHRMSSRPWVFVTGRLEGEALRIGDELTVTHDGQAVGVVTVSSVELHGAPGKTTVAVDAGSGELLQEGSVLSLS
ncbi:hypothetical protein [Nucisporomicrobium flavum]|nr:hypothetical protein [Nucisporomicrobium flavum]